MIVFAEASSFTDKKESSLNMSPSNNKKYIFNSILKVSIATVSSTEKAKRTPHLVDEGEKINFRSINVSREQK